MPRGRPSTFTQKIADTICDRLIEGESLRAICREEGMPGIATVMQWLDRNPTFAAQYTRARELQADALDWEIMEAARQAPERVTVTVGENATKTCVDGGEVNNRRLLIDTLKWRACHLRPKRYKTATIEHSGSVSLESLVAPDAADA
jgi:hypothetical protein